MKNSTLKLILFALGTIIGAGFASGKEIATFFAEFGFLSIPLSLLCGVLFYLTAKLFLSASKEIKPKNFSDVSKYLFKEKGGTFNFFIVVCFVVSIGSMIAGANALGKILIFDYNSHMIAIFITIVTILITFGGLKFITKINYILVPLMVIVIFATCILSFVYIPQVSDIQIVQVGLQNYFMGFGSSILYVSLNMLMSGLLFMEIGNKYTSKQIKTASLVFGASVSLLIVLISVSLLTSNFTIFNSELPLIALALNINKMWSYGVALIVWFAILTSTIGNCYVVAMYLKKHLKSYKLSVVLTGLFALMFSVIGFSTIVGVVYPIMGVIGLVLILLIFKRTNNVNINVFSQKHKTSLHSSAKL